MKLVLTAVALACLAPVAALAQTAPAPATAPAATPAPAAAASTAKFNLDTPIETIVADEKAKAVLATSLGADVTANPAYESFKAMSLRQVQPFAPDKLTDELLKKVETDLAAIK
ncbi:hypothetical protein IAG41_12725 [Sphingomonas sp. JC676]|uniref:hypothetical protein n=1 Tax=Sphingomonas sp. JC676 TaxID=2768065 RepID=UPI001657FBFC|nr:hypothetical protein [Sphingomonas sp. JC676]MBC9033255.1 hypothetical protein [Sphingomonas sp. JC676]